MPTDPDVQPAEPTPLDEAISNTILPLADKALSERMGVPVDTQFEYNGEYFVAKIGDTFVRARVPLQAALTDPRGIAKEVADAIQVKVADTVKAAKATRLKIKLKQACLEFETGDVVAAPEQFSLRHARALIDDDIATLEDAELPPTFTDGVPPNKAMKRETVKAK